MLEILKNLIRIILKRGFQSNGNVFRRWRIELIKGCKLMILLLDEPTNHLDIESIIWLESFLRNYIGVVVIVSHDKMFLDNVTNRTIEISLGKAYDFNKPYSISGIAS
jgi:ATP-binding cassette subfamily F protein 3